MGDRFWSYDPEDGFETHATAEAAQARAYGAIDLYRDDAYDGWPDDVELICWGEIRQTAVVVDRQDRCTARGCEYDDEPPESGDARAGPCNGHHRHDVDEVIDYGLADLAARGE